MSILSRNYSAQPKPAVIRVDRVACPRCATVNCTRHNAAPLTSRAISQQWRGA